MTDKFYPPSYALQDKVMTFQEEVLDDIEKIIRRTERMLSEKDYEDFMNQLKEMVSDE